MVMQYRVTMENHHLSDKVAKTNFFDRGDTARRHAEKWSKKYSGEYAHLEATEEWEFEDSLWTYMGVFVNGIEYNTSDKRIRDLIEKGLTYIQAKRYTMHQDGMSMQRIAKIEDSIMPITITKAAVQKSIEQARDKLSQN